MSKAVIADTKPTVLDLEAGTKWWCACGRSKSQPWCDGSHKGTGFTPVEVTLDEPKRVAMCNCKQSSKAPFCDGTHAELPS